MALLRKGTSSLGRYIGDTQMRHNKRGTIIKILWFTIFILKIIQQLKLHDIYRPIKQISQLSTMKIITLLVLVCLTLAIDNPIHDTLYRKQSVKKNLRQQQYWFDQVTDHYNYDSANSLSWKQRYWAITDYFNPEVGPVFLYICGEWVCSGVPETRTWIGVLAQKLQGLILVLEHRFYGDSLPFGKESFSIENMVLLNSQQALRDLAHFIEVIKKEKKFGINNNPWISVGGSYPGALSAWFRYKYPHLVIGALASSAVVLAIEDFKDFDEQIYLSSSKSSGCSQALNESSHRVEAIINKGQQEADDFKSQFEGGQKLSNKQFLFYWADAIVLTIQYGGRTMVCNKLKGQTPDDQFKIIIENAKNFPVYEYGSFYLRNQTLTYETRSASRPWYYQYCTEYAFFQTFSDRHPMRSFQLDLKFFHQFCADAFGEGTTPRVNHKNIEYGGLDAKSSKVIFSNGVQDPWRWASLQHTDSPELISRVIDCDNCAHCVDLYTPDQDDDDNLKHARDEQFLTISQWVDDYWREVRKEQLEAMLRNEI